METLKNEKIHSLLIRIARWNVFHFLSETEDKNPSEIFEDVSFDDEIPLDNLNYPALMLNVDEHLVISLKFNLTPIFLRDYFHLFGFIDKRPYLIGEIVFGRDEKTIEVLGYELKIINAPHDKVYSCRFCPCDEIDPGESTLLKIVLKNRRQFEEEFNNFYNSSLMQI